MKKFNCQITFPFLYFSLLFLFFSFNFFIKEVEEIVICTDIHKIIIVRKVTWTNSTEHVI